MYILQFKFSKYVWQEKVFRNGSIDHGFYNFEFKRFFFSLLLICGETNWDILKFSYLSVLHLCE